jgi:hypothetical protein
MQQLGAGGGTEGVKAFPESALRVGRASSCDPVFEEVALSACHARIAESWGDDARLEREIAASPCTAEDMSADIRDTRYAKTQDSAYIAYQTAGEGPIDLVWQFDFVGNVDLAWEWPGLRGWLPGLAAFCRVILHDRRGTGLSSRNVVPPNLETRVSDLRLVLDAVGSDRPVLAGFSEAGAPNVMFAATNPERVRSIVWFVASGSDRIRSEDPK